MTFINILLVIALVAVVVVLFTGIIGFLHGGEFNRKYGNKLMRARVGLQFAAIILLGLLFLAGN